MQHLDLTTSDIYTIRNREFTALSDFLIENKHDISPIKQNNQHGLESIPKSFYFADIIDVDCVSLSLLDYFRKFRENFCKEYDLDTGLMVYYPENGFIDWHTNENVPYYSAICTYSANGDSFFEFVNTEKNVVRLNDPVGWSVKFSKWCKEDPIYHRAVSYTDRITIAFISPEKHKILSFIEDIKGDKIG